MLASNSSASCCWVRSFSVICPREVGRPDSLGPSPARHAKQNGDGLWRALTGYDGRGRAWLGVRRQWPPGRPRCGAHPKLQAAKRAGAAALSTRRPRPVGRSCPTATPRLQNRPVRLTQTGGSCSTATPNRAEFAGSRTASSASRPAGVTGCDGSLAPSKASIPLVRPVQLQPYRPSWSHGGLDTSRVQAGSAHNGCFCLLMIKQDRAVVGTHLCTTLGADSAVPERAVGSPDLDRIRFLAGRSAAD